MIKFSRLEHRRAEYWTIVSMEELEEMQSMSQDELDNFLCSVDFNCDSDEPVDIDMVDYARYYENGKEVILIDETDTLTL